MPLVSVVIPTYNSAHYLPETIASIQAQDFDDFEIIIVDDRSTDNTKEVIAGLDAGDIRYYCLDANHGGPSRPRNVGIRNARGTFIAFCDSDDLLRPGRIGRAVKFLQSNPDLGLVFTNAKKFDDQTGTDLGEFLNNEYKMFHSLPKKQVGENSFLIAAKDAFSCLFYENFITTPSAVTVPKRIFEIVGLFDESLTNGDDWDMWFRISRLFPIVYIDEISFKYRIRAGSISKRGPILAINRSRVVKKQLSADLPIRLRKRCWKIVSRNDYGIGYYYQTLGEMRHARKYYRKSLRESFNLSAARGLLISMLGKKIYFWLKKMKDDRGK